MDLVSSVSTLSLVGPVYQRRLEKLEIASIEDFLLHVPHRYLDFSLTSPIARVQPGETLTIKGEVLSIKNQYTRSGKKIQMAEVSDKSGKILVVWFNQPFLVRVLYPGTNVSLAGKVDWFGRKKALVSPEFEKLTEGQKPVHTGRIIPVYPETSGVSSKWIRGRMVEAFIRTKKSIVEFLPEEALKELGLPGFYQAVKDVHFPDNLESAELGRKRLAFNELLFLQLKNQDLRLKWKTHKAAFKLNVDKTITDKFIDSLPFELTRSQVRSVEEIFSDITKVTPMNRLLEGDVGSGKTVVAAAASFVSFTNGCQTVFMAPTQILAQQHFQTLNKLFSPYKVRISLLTSELTKSQIGRSDVFVGTHALIHRKIDFDKVGLVVIDEQHRFGVEQRAHLIKKVKGKTLVPHVLTMTATPIPRTVALTFYGDLDLSTLDELPKGRLKITTWIVPPQKREGAYTWIEEKIKKEKVQAFVICPLIEESLIETMKSVKAVTEEYKDLKKVFKDLKLGLLHGRLPAKEKERVVEEFRKGKVDILVSTPVVEVGIDIPNAVVMVIEAAERFGLSQLHQLRGRVGRGEVKSYCLLFAETKSPRVLTRLNALTENLSGFELAELDLKLRGPGEIFGTKQHGFPELKIASWQDIELIKKSKKLAEDIFANPEKFEKVTTFLLKKQMIAN